jgi:hypothetical protein
VAELRQALADERYEEVFAELRRFRSELDKRRPALEALVEAVLERFLPSGPRLRAYFGRHLYALRLREQLVACDLSPAGERALVEAARGSLIDELRAEASDPEAIWRLQRGVGRGAARTFSLEAARLLREQGRDWLYAAWLAPYRIDYFMERISFEHELPPAPLLERALLHASDTLGLIADDENAILLRARLARDYVLPYLLAHAWPQVLDAIEHEAARDPLIVQARGELGEIVQRARALRRAKSGA